VRERRRILLHRDIQAVPFEEIRQIGGRLVVRRSASHPGPERDELADVTLKILLVHGVGEGLLVGSSGGGGLDDSEEENSQTGQAHLPIVGQITAATGGLEPGTDHGRIDNRDCKMISLCNLS
jgi:hypothetical protein